DGRGADAHGGGPHAGGSGPRSAGPGHRGGRSRPRPRGLGRCVQGGRPGRGPVGRRGGSPPHPAAGDRGGHRGGGPGRRAAGGRRARRLGAGVRLVVRGERLAGRRVKVAVAPEPVPFGDPLAGRGGDAVLILRTDVGGEIGVLERTGTVDQTAYAVLSDLLTI